MEKRFPSSLVGFAFSLSSNLFPRKVVLCTMWGGRQNASMNQLLGNLSRLHNDKGGEEDMCPRGCLVGWDI